AAEKRVRLERVPRTQVHVAPGRIPGADLQHDEVERPQPRANVLVFSREPGIAAEENTVPLRSHHERRPQRRVTRSESPAGEVLRRRRGQPNAPNLVRLPPVEL